MNADRVVAMLGEVRQHEAAVEKRTDQLTPTKFGRHHSVAVHPRRLDRIRTDQVDNIATEPP